MSNVGVHVEITYSESREPGYTVFKSDTIIFPYEEQVEAAAWKYLWQMINKTPEFAVCVKRMEELPKKDCFGMPVTDKRNCKMFRRDRLSSSVCRITSWKDDCYSAEEHYADLKTAFKELKEEVEIQLV